MYLRETKKVEAALTKEKIVEIHL
ncbi:hypothetical protein A2U01_0082225, partial [Trifolium medium]|nr:hypothetical protein [Trifolium medium]